MTRRRRGQVLVFFALVLPMIVLPAAAYAIDAVAAASAFARLEEVTARAAEEAAEQLDEMRLRSSGEIVVGLGPAQSLVHSVIADLLPDARVLEVTVAGSAVRVRTTEAVNLPLQFIGVPGITLHASATARLTAGYESPSSLLPFLNNTF